MTYHSEEEKAIEIQSLREQFSIEFDQTHQELKVALKDPALYEELRKNYVNSRLLEIENQNLKTALDNTKTILETKTKQVIERSIDSVTGLRRREIMYETIEKEVERLFNQQLETLSEQELLDYLKSLDPVELKNTKLSVLMSDVSFLSLVNDKAGHASGDKFMFAMGEVARAVGSPGVTLPEEEPMDAKFVASRHGGDEISAIIRADKRGAEEIAKEFRLKVKVSKEAGKILEPYHFEPNLDVGIAHITEGIEAFRRFLAEIIKRDVQIPRGERKKKLIDFMMNIADRRATLQKGETRINLLVNLKKDTPAQYEETISWLRKGAFNASDAEIDRLIELRAQLSEEDWKKKLQEFLRGKERESHEKDLEIRAIERSIIQSIAG